MRTDVGSVQTRTLKTFRAWGMAFKRRRGRRLPVRQRGGDVLIALGRGLEDGDGDVASPSVSGVAMSSSPWEGAFEDGDGDVASPFMVSLRESAPGGTTPALRQAAKPRPCRRCPESPFLRASSG